MAQALPKVSTGTLERLEDFPSKFVAPRHVDVWLPPGYSQGGLYSVIYMHDGQMLFDAKTTWNKQAWQVDVTVARLIKDQRIPPAIVVGIWNNGKYRHAEYFPQKQLDYLPSASRDKLIAQALEGKPLADAYLRFLVEELKPTIDRKYATRPDTAHTFVMGSSMGGLISVYAMSEYPQVFGGAAGLSTHWVGSHQANATLPLAGFNYLRDHLAAPEGHRLYQDHGTIELDALYAPYQTFVDEIVRERGYTQTNFMSRTFENEGHNEMAWAKRLEIPLVFLMGNWGAP
jgi:enterochelin esterase-like enzyme